MVSGSRSTKTTGCDCAMYGDGCGPTNKYLSAPRWTSGAPTNTPLASRYAVGCRRAIENRGSMPRLAINEFAHEMEITLLRNDAKPCWSAMGTDALIDKLEEEVGELIRELRTWRDLPGNAPRVGFEALDVAAVAMFCWDMSRGEGASKDRGRS